MKYDVAIVGAGPVGTTLAALLAKRGLSVVVLERDLDIYPLQRAAHLVLHPAQRPHVLGRGSRRLCDVVHGVVHPAIVLGTRRLEPS